MSENVAKMQREFDDAHGDGILNENKTGILYPDGAFREISAYGALTEPHPDPRQRTLHIRSYWKLKLERLTTAFHQKRDMLRSVASPPADNRHMCSPPPDKAELEELKKIQAEVKSVQKQYEQACKDFDDALPEHVKARQEESRKNREKCQDYLSLLNSIEV